jgi:localization factor PodJL
LVDSEFNLGILYERGFGVARDLVEAYRWFALAALQDDDKARQKRDEVAKLLTPAERRKADRLIAEWSPKSRAAETSRSASDVPAGDKGGEEQRGAPRAMQTTSAAVVNASWQTDVAASNKPAPDASLVMEAQRLLRQRGYDPGPADGVPGPRTQNAIRSFQRKAGLPATGEASEVLIVKLAFLPL